MKMPDRRNCRRIVSLTAFIGALVAYLFTIDPDASFWDCPEYIVTAWRLEVGHPPGNPVWTLMARICTLFVGNNPEYAALAVNLSSAIFTALAVGILASCIFITLSLLFPRLRKSLLIPIASLGGALCFGWSDSPWFSAVEAEVYAMSLFLTALTLRLMLGWALRPDRMAARREILLIIYLTGLSIGVHQLNLLVIPALGLIWLFRRYPGRVGFWRIIGVMIASMAAIGIILLVFMPGVIDLAAQCELLCVNTLHMPFYSGVIIFWTLAMLLSWGIPIWLQTFRRPVSHRLLMILWTPAMLLTGYSSYMILLVRGAADTPMNEGAPSNIFALASYLGRDQYGSKPLLYGRTPHSRRMRIEKMRPDGTPDYNTYATEDKGPRYAQALPDSSERDAYLLYDRVHKPIYTPELDMFLPRITSADPTDLSCYADWAGMNSGNMTEVEVSYALDSLGNPVGKLGADGKRVREKALRPTYRQNLRYMAAYQIAYMYGRYLMWNYVGRQNDRFAIGEVEHGQFISGIVPVDDLMLGPQDKLPREIGADNAGRNRYFFLPLLLGIAGMIFLQHRGRFGRRANLIVTLLFLMTGLAIVIYLNQDPREARERDYSFLGSFWAYAIWIGMGMAWLLHLPYSKWISKRLGKGWRKAIAAGAAIVSLGLPAYMLAENFDDHDRSGRRAVTDFATNILESLEPNAILFTNGDNYTFPLWYAQEVLGVRRDVTIINTAYLVTPWYVTQLQRPGEESAALQMQMRPGDILYGGATFSSYRKSQLIPTSLDTLGAEDALTALRRRFSENGYVFPAMLRLVNPEGGDSIYVRTSAVASASSSINLRQLAALDIIASNAASAHPRPVYWQFMLGSGDYAGLYPLTSRVLHTRRLIYSDTLSAEMSRRLLDQDLKEGLLTRPGKRNLQTRIYVDPTVGSMISGQRMALLRLGGRLLRAGRYADAAAIAEVMERNFPAREWEYQDFYESDSVCREGVDLARLKMEAARGLNPGGDMSRDSLYMQGLRLLQREADRYAEWRNYRFALPAWYQNGMTPKNQRKTRNKATLDSLKRVYTP